MFFSTWSGVGRGVLEGASVGVKTGGSVFCGAGVAELEGMLAGRDVQLENSVPAVIRTTNNNLVDFITTLGL